MSERVGVSITSRNIIKPSSPTPSHLRNFRLSLLDQIYPPFYGPLVLFYSSCVPSVSCLLQESLSQTLVHFHPLAGQLMNAACIDSSDQGAYWVDARVNCHLVDFLRQPDHSLLNQFLPFFHPETMRLASGYMLIVQITFFDCGGIAISPCTSHKLCDALSLSCLINNWFARAKGQFNQAILPNLIGGSMLPSREFPLMLSDNCNVENCDVIRLVFSASSIAALKAKTPSLRTMRLTKVDLVLALILRCAIQASNSLTGSSKPALLCQMVNLRRKMIPPLHDNDVGNFALGAPLLIKENELETHHLIYNMKRDYRNFINEKASRFNGAEGFSVVCEYFTEWASILKDCANGVNLFRCTSICKFPFYNMDFGSGKPVWVSIPSNIKNLIVLADTNVGDGVEAWVNLGKQEMAVFLSNEELLQYAALNPTIIHVPGNHSRM